MSKNNSLSNLDTGQAFKRTLDGDNEAIRVVQVNDQDVFIEVSAEDGDSVQSVARHKLLTGTQACSDLREICKYGENGTVEISPDGTDWYTLTIAHLEVKSICANKIRITDCKVVGRS